VQDLWVPHLDGDRCAGLVESHLRRPES
jgi:hypothetical protein